MKNKNNTSLIIAIVFAAVLISGSLVFASMKYAQSGGDYDSEEFQKQITEGIEKYIAAEQAKYASDQEKQSAPTPIEGDFEGDDPFKGDDDAPVVIVEFSDYECPYCSVFFNDVLPELEKNYIDTGKVKLVYRDYPIESKHPSAFPSALFAECVRDQLDDEAYFKVHDEIFNTISNGFDYATMETFAEKLGADKADLKECFDQQKFRAEIDEDIASAKKAGIDGTPGFIINNVRIPGLRSYEFYQDYIDKELARLQE